MVNPILTPKESTGFTLTPNIKKLFQVIYRDRRKEETASEEPKIKVSEIISKMSFYYEKIRNSVDDKEEYLMHKNAIQRILKRLIIIEQVKDGSALAGMLLIDLIRAGYLPNNKIPESRIEEFGQVLDKYIELKTLVLADLADNHKNRKETTRWIIAMAACDIEERLGRNDVARVVISNMYETLAPLIKLPERSPYEKDKEILIYTSIQRNYLKADRDMLAFVLFKYFEPEWREGDRKVAVHIAKNIGELRNKINYQLNHPLVDQINKTVIRYAIYSSILTEVVSEDPVEIYESFKSDPKAFPRNIKKICQKRYKSVKARLWRAAVRSIIYLFVTKMALVLILEIPVSNWLGETTGYGSLAVNVAFPPALLFLIVLFTRLPTDANTAKIVEGVEGLVFKEEKEAEPIRLRQPARRSRTANAIFNFIYAITFFISFGAVIWALDKINFNVVSIIIFLFFLALISFFSIRIRRRVRELSVIEIKENILGFFADFFYVPIIAVGKWLSEKFSRINVFVFILDFIIEAPFKLFVEIAEEWTKYVRERKEDVIK